MQLDEEPQKFTFDLDSSQGDSIEYYSKSGKKKKKGKLLSKSKKSHTDVHTPGKLSTKDHKKPSGSNKKTTGKEKDPLIKKEKKGNTLTPAVSVASSPTPTKSKKLERPVRPTERVGPSSESAMLIQKRNKKFNTMPTELPSASQSLKITRTNSEEKLKFLKRSSSSQATNLEVPVSNYSPSSDDYKQPPMSPSLSPPVSPHWQNMKIEVEWNKKTQVVEIGLVNVRSLKEIVANAFNIDLEFVSRMCLDVILELYLNGDTELLTEKNLPTLYNGNGRLHLVILDDDS